MPLVSGPPPWSCDAGGRGHLVLRVTSSPVSLVRVEIQGRGALPAAGTAGGWDGVAGLPCARGRQSGPGVEVTCLSVCPVTAPWSLPGNRGLEHLRAGGQVVAMALTLYRVQRCLLHIPPNWETSYILFFLFFCLFWPCHEVCRILVVAQW